MAELVQDLKMLIRTRHAIVSIRTLEEEFATRQVREAAREMGWLAMEWTVSDGLRLTIPTVGETFDGTQALAAALRHMRDSDQPNIYILKDALAALKDPAVARLLRDTAMEFTKDWRTIFMIDAAGELPVSLRPLSVPFEIALPDAEEIAQLVKHTATKLTRSRTIDVGMTAEQFTRFLANMRGLTRMEVTQVVADAILGHGRLTAEDVDRPVAAKRHRLRQTGVLDYIPPPDVPPRVGGMEHLHRWLALRTRAFSPDARQYGLEPPRGILMLGVQGCGKSLMARYVAACWGMPLLRMDVGALYDKYVGESERHLRAAFDMVAAMAPCVLWIDEIEKAFASSVGPDAGQVDGGLSQRMFGMLLTWMQDHRDPVFLVATANDVAALPPELLRKGRFDEIFFVDLPDKPARRAIFEIHLARRGHDPARFGLDALADAAEGFSGAEIEQAIVASLYVAFGQRRALTTDDVLAELQATRPLSVVMGEKITALRAWADGRCVRAD